MLISELATAVKYRLPVKIFVIKNDSLGQIKSAQMVFLGNPDYCCERQPIEFVGIAPGGGGVQAYHVDNPEKCGEAVAQALALKATYPRAGMRICFEAATAQAAAEGRAIVMNFTASDWCVWCHRLHDEVFVQQAFVDFTAGSLAPVEVNFPRPAAGWGRYSIPPRRGRPHAEAPGGLLSQHALLARRADPAGLVDRDTFRPFVAVMQRQLAHLVQLAVCRIAPVQRALDEQAKEVGQGHRVLFQAWEVHRPVETTPACLT